MAKNEGIKLKMSGNYRTVKDTSKRTSSFWSYITNVGKWSEIIKPQSKSSKDNTSVNNNNDKKIITIHPKEQKPEPLNQSESNEIKKAKREKKIKKRPSLKKLTAKTSNIGNKNSVHVISHKLQSKTSQLLNISKKKPGRSSNDESILSTSVEKQNWKKKVSKHQLNKINNLTSKNVPALEEKPIRSEHDEKTRIIVMLLQKIKKLETQITDLQYLSPPTQDSMVSNETYNDNEIYHENSFKKITQTEPDQLRSEDNFTPIDAVSEYHKAERVKRKKQKKQKQFP